MMMNKRLIQTAGESKKYIAGNVILQWCSLAANIGMMTAIAGLLQQLFYKNADGKAYSDDSRRRSGSGDYTLCLYSGGCENVIFVFEKY